MGFFPSQRGRHRHIQSLALSHGGTALVLIQLQTQHGEQEAGENSTTEEESFCSERAFKHEIEIPDSVGSQGERAERIQLRTNQAGGGGKGRTHRVVAALISNHLNPGHAWSQRLGWREAHRNLCLLKQWLHTELGCTIAVTRENGEPRTDTRCLTKTRIKNRQTAVGQFVSYTIYSRLRGVFFFSSQTQKRSHRKYICCCHSALFTPKRSVKHWSQPYSHGFGSKPCHASLRVISAALTIWFFSFSFSLFFPFLCFPSPRSAVCSSRTVKQQTMSWGQLENSSCAPPPEYGQEELRASPSSEAIQSHQLSCPMSCS